MSCNTNGLWLDVHLPIIYIYQLITQQIYKKRMKQTQSIPKQKQIKFTTTPLHTAQQKRKKPNRQQIISNKRQENQDIDWLENIVKQFQKYKGDCGDEKQQGGKDDECMGEVGRGRNCGIGSCQRGLGVNDYNKKNSGGKNREIRHQVVIKKLSANRTQGTQSSKKKYEHQSSTQNLKYRAPFTPKPSSISQQKNHKKQQILPSTSEIINSIQIRVLSNTSQSLKNLQPQHFSQPEHNPKQKQPSYSPICPISLNNPDPQTKPTPKYSLPQAKRLAHKIAVKEDRKYFVHQTGKISIGKIVKNKSVEIKQKRYQDKQNIGIAKKQYRKQEDGNYGKEKGKGKECEIVEVEKSCCNQIQNFLSSRSRDRTNRVSEENSINKVVKEVQKNIKKSQQEILFTIKEVLKEQKKQNIGKQENKNKIMINKDEQNQNSNSVKQRQKQKQKVIKNRITFSLADLSRQARNIQKQTQLAEKPQKQPSNHKQPNIPCTQPLPNPNQPPSQPETKKFHYLTETLQNRLQKLCHKKQRKLNSSFGQRKILHYDYNTRDNVLLSSKKKYNYGSSPKIVYTCPMEQVDKNGGVNLSQFSTIQNHVENDKKQQMQTTKSQIQTTKSKIETTKSKIPTYAPPMYQNLAGLSIANKVKLVQSAHNSQVFTEHSLVIEKSQALNNIDAIKYDSLSKQYLHGSESKEQDKGEWNIMQIFQKLDRKKIGVLDADNCSIEYISRQIRYILGAVLQQILYKDIRYNFSDFIARVQQTLQKIKDPSLPPSYHKLKQLAPTTRRSIQPLPLPLPLPLPQPPHPSSHHHHAPLGQTLTSQTDKKYKYSQVFIDGPQTQPTYSTANKNNGSSCNKSNKVIRFATFQDQDIEKGEQEREREFVLGDGDADRLFGVAQSRQSMLGSSVWAILTRQQQLQKKLQHKLQKLNQFKSTTPTNINNHLTSLPHPAHPAHPAQLAQTHNFNIPSYSLVLQQNNYYQSTNSYKTQDHSNQMIKLQQLNKRLQKYLYDQNMKQFCSSKLIVDG